MLNIINLKFLNNENNYNDYNNHKGNDFKGNITYKIAKLIKKDKNNDNEGNKGINHENVNNFNNIDNKFDSIIHTNINNKLNNTLFNNNSGNNGNNSGINNKLNINFLNEVSNSDFINSLNFKVVIPLFVGFLAIIFTVCFLVVGLEIAITVILIILMSVFLLMYSPKIRQQKVDSNISRELPYALRQMVTELRSGKGLHDTMKSIVKSDYGDLSKEFSRVLEEIRHGETTENALMNMSKRIKSDGLNRALHQIIGTLRTGGNLSNTLNIIAEDISYDFRINLKEYSQKLNGFVMIYTFLAILAPVILLIMVIAASTVIGDVIPSTVILILYIFFFPMIVVFMGIMIKRMEPHV
ncbi:type II secretion system F family protein [Methanobrevibacter filiformis]|uniref:type II secretion system F family protein n=1 Tax=Methanobrevibacter filiformis TaxID=55758 RepID=UPI001FE1EFAE|nr:type II secretion system F family protein [Methanobrevibacter filiformis]